MPPVTSRPIRRWAGRVVRIVVLVFLGLCGAVYVGQDWMMFPAARGRGEPPRPFRLGPAARRVDLRLADGTPIAAAFAVAARADGSPRSDAATRPTVLFFYGNGADVQSSWGQLDGFRRLGANVMIPDYPGYGASGGRPGEAGLYAAADAADDWLHRQRDVDGRKLILAGWSLGAAAAIDLASRRPPAAVAVFNAFTSMPEMGHQVIPWLPSAYLCRARFANEDKIRSVRCPTLIVNGALDELVPPSMSGRLAAAAGGPVTRLTIPTADHNGIFDADPTTVWAAVQRLVEAVDAEPRH